MPRTSLVLLAGMALFFTFGCRSDPGHHRGDGHDHGDGKGLHSHGEQGHGDNAHANKEQAGHDHHADGVHCGCTAKKAAGENFWCDNCQKGNFDGKELGCGSCYQGLSGKNVWCDKCNKGFVGGEAKTCKGCYEASINGTTCEKCAAKKEGV